MSTSGGLVYLSADELCILATALEESGEVGSWTWEGVAHVQALRARLDALWVLIGSDCPPAAVANDADESFKQSGGTDRGAVQPELPVGNA